MTEPIEGIVARLEVRIGVQVKSDRHDIRALIASWRERGEALKSIELMARDYLHVATPEESVIPALVDQIGRIRICAAAALIGEPKCAD